MDHWPPEPETETETEHCELTRDRVGRFVSELLPPAELQEMRAHMDDCPACMDHYKEAVRAAAELGRATRTLREQQELDRFRKQRRRDLFDPPGRRGRWYRLRTLLYPAFVIFLIVQVTRFETEPTIRPGFVLGWERGEVEADGLLHLEAPPEEVVLSRGAYCATRGEEAQSTLVHGDTRLELVAHSALHVVGVEPPSVRFHTGELRFSGPAEIFLSSGVVSQEVGRGEVLGSHGRFLVRCVDGRLTVTDVAGELTLEAGDSVRLPRT